MRVIEAQNAVLTNVEVYEFLNDQARQHHKEKRRAPGNLETVRKELLQYLESSPNPMSQRPLPYNVAAIPILIKKLRPYSISKGECVMIMNLRPTSIANLNAVLEDMEGRFNEDAQQSIVDIVIEVLGQFPPPPEEEEGDAMQTTE
ncbi:Uu.00g072900.m01.CDS01 [Anthostomella pinea]|uniref:DNA-directed RNA polymerase III subunit RPC9 n=1 Tax=Anthostomella pinea TaxID=933095 RepID=A0AAI8VVT5_9PEZI|nr:Uu.00g072900.m01.CDS01 [Anthostomella pinea]